MTVTLKNKIWKALIICVLTVLILLPCMAMAVELDEYEDDDEFNRASLISGKPQHHNFHDEGDADWVMFFIESGNTYRIEVNNMKTDCYAVLEFYDSADYENPILTEKIKNNFIEWNFNNKKGLYFLKIKQYDVSCEGTEYDIKISLTAAGAGQYVQFTVSDVNGNRIPYVHIEIKGYSTSYCGHSLGECWNGGYFDNLPGIYYLHLESGDYTLTAGIEGYKKYEEKFTVKGNISLFSKEITMEKTSENIPISNTNCNDISDSIRILQILAGIPSALNENPIATASRLDKYMDCKIDMADAIIFLQILAGIR